MRTLSAIAALATILLAAGACLAGGLSSTGNADGHLTWRVGTLEPGRSDRRGVLFAFGPSYAEALAPAEAQADETAPAPVV